MKSPEWKPGPAVLNEKWEARKPRLFPREYFNLQFEFAKELQRRTGDNLLDIIKTRTSSLRFGLFEYDGYVYKGEKPGLNVADENSLVDFSYADYLQRKEHDMALEYHPEGSTRFGCFSYDFNDKNGDLRIHFMNAEFGDTGPLSAQKIARRQKELRDTLGDIKEKHPDIESIKGLSWLYNLEAYKRLFPESYTRGARVVAEPFQWARGTSIWGQFIDNQYHLKEDAADELLRRLRALPPQAELSDIFRDGPPILPPLETRGPLKDFYEMYGV